MPDSSTLGVFLAASVALLVIPGPTALYIIARGVSQGKTAALVSALGVELGTLVHLLVATVGLSTLVASSDMAFTVVKCAGAAYLLWLGISALLQRSAHSFDTTQSTLPLRPVFLQGVMVEVLNPETALFFLAFMPQFADPARGDVERQMLMLGGIFILLAICNDGLLGLVSGSVGGWLRGNARYLTAQRYVCSCVYASLAIYTILAGSSTV